MRAGERERRKENVATETKSKEGEGGRKEEEEEEEEEGLLVLYPKREIHTCRHLLREEDFKSCEQPPIFGLIKGTTRAPGQEKPRIPSK